MANHKALLIYLFGALFLVCGNHGYAQTSEIGELASQTNVETIRASRPIMDSVYKSKDPRMGGRGKLMEKVDSVQQSVDGLVSSINEKTEDIKNNTHFGTKEWIGWWVAFFSLVFAAVTFMAQNKTEKHTQKAPKKAQLGVLKDLPRHFYRNLACTCASHIKFRSQTPTSGGLRKLYPSEANILKLSTLPDEFILPIDSGNDPVYRKMHEEKLLFKNYNLEVEVAAKHFAIKGITDTSLTNDYDNLLFKPMFLITRMLEFQDMITKDEKKNNVNGVVYAIYAFVKEHFEKLGFKAFIDNHNNEIAFIKSITTDKDFVTLIGVKEDSIERSLKLLLKYKKSDSDQIEFLKRGRNKEGEFDGKGTIEKESFVTFFEKWYAAEALDKKTKGVDSLKKVFRVHCVEDFSEAFNEGKMNPKVRAAFNALKFYFDFMQKDEWEVKELLFAILKVDAILEISKIGMIEY